MESIFGYDPKDVGSSPTISNIGRYTNGIFNFGDLNFSVITLADGQIVSCINFVDLAISKIGDIVSEMSNAVIYDSLELYVVE